MARMGRPPKKSAERLSAQLAVRFTPSEMRIIKAKAKAKGISAAELLRRAGLERD